MTRMEPISRQMFFNPTKGEISFEQVQEEILSYMQELPERSYEIIVGCDSPAVEDPSFPLAVVVLRNREGGRFFLCRMRDPGRRFFNLHQRILQEVLYSCELALFLRDEFALRIRERHPGLRFAVRYIHADVGENGPTRDMIKEVTGMIRGNGFEPCVKPQSFAASSVADRYS